MILANSTWGGWIAACGVPAIYRSQQSLAPGVKVRMGLRAAPHAGIGVAHYAWATSPLRRYVDLVNQWQLIACARHGKTAALAAPFRANDVNLHAIVSGFDAAYAEYNGFQGAIECYWSLRSLLQDRIGELEATVMKDGLVRAETLPLVFRAAGAEPLPRGTRVRVRLGAPDLLTLDLNATVVARLDTAAVAADAAGAEDDEPAAGPLTIAVDVAEATEPGSGEPPVAESAAAA
jgi:exoribonuclease-2